MKNLIERLRDYGGPDTDEAADSFERLTAENALLHERHVFSNKILKEQQAALEATRAERDALKSALQLIKANTSRADWPDDINAAIQGEQP